MEKRPDFETLASYEEFKKYYWYRKELSGICRRLGIEYRGTKQELNHHIDLYFDETYENTFNYDVYDGIELWLQENADGRLLASVRKYKGAPGYARLAETIRTGMKG